ncbi:hypothetical protein MRX96_017355 [Rhipicephalus microplus]
MRFFILKFTEEQTVAFVPNIKIVGCKCYWPPGRGCKMATVQKAKAPRQRMEKLQHCGECYLQHISRGS